MKGATKARPSVRSRHGSRVGNRLAVRLAAHEAWPVRSDGKEGEAKGAPVPMAKRPGSMNPRKH